MKNVLCVSLLLVFLLVFTVSCTQQDVQPSDTQPSSTQTTTTQAGNGEIDVIESTQYYRLVQETATLMYQYEIFDKDSNVVKTETLSREPEICLLDNSLVKVTVQAGTGLSTQRGYFYDTQSNTFSETFYCIYDQADGKVAYGEAEKVVVADIFNPDNYYWELSNFKEGLADTVAEPIIRAEFLEGGNKLKVVYLAGPDHIETEEVFDLQ